MNVISTELVWRRFAEPFSDWMIAVPVLFALVVLFIVSCLRQDKGIGTLLIGLCLLGVVSVSMVYNHVTHGGPKIGDYDCGRLIDILLKFVAAPLMVGGFVANLLLEFKLQPLIAWAGGAAGRLQIGWVALLMNMGYVSLEAKLDPTKETLPVQIAPTVALFLVQVVLSALRARLWIGLAVVGVLSAVYLPFAYHLKPHPDFSWWVILVPVLAVALFYVCMMYICDAKTIHWAWAAFLGLLRVGVYAILAIVFLRPGEESRRTTETYPKVLVLLDVSGSMNWKDELARPGQTDKRKTRQDKIIEFLTERKKADIKGVDGPKGTGKIPWILRLLDKSPVAVYRFGDKLDDFNKRLLTEEKGMENWSEEDWKAYCRLLEDDWRTFLHPGRPEVHLDWQSFLDVGGPEADHSEAKFKEHTLLRSAWACMPQLSDVEKERFPTKKEQDEELLRRSKLRTALLRATNVPGVANYLSKIESSSYVQAIIIISDGRSNTSSEQEVREFLARVNNPNRKIHVFTIGVGDFKQPVEIRIEEMQSPQTIRPDERFPLRVPVLASRSLRNTKFEMLLEARRTRDGQQVALAPTWWARRTLPVSKFEAKEGTFLGEGEFPQFVVEYEIDLVRVFMQMNKKLVKDVTGLDVYDYEKDIKPREPEIMELALRTLDNVDTSKIKKESLKAVFMERFLEGEWEFVARVKKNDQEEFEHEYHMSEPPARVKVKNKTPRVLLFAGGPTRDYQFTRVLLAREAQAKRIELSVYLQSGARLEGVDQDVPAERLLTHFPHRRGPDDPKDKFSSINMYDVIIAFDPDWEALAVNVPDPLGDPTKKVTNEQQARLIKNWVANEGGGIIFVAGPVNTYQLATASPLLGDLPKMVPVILKDLRLHPPDIDMKRPFPLTFTEAAKTTDFLKLELAPKVDGPTAGWERFFWGEAGSPLNKGDEPERGFFSFYPTEEKRAGAMVLATFDGGPPTFTSKGEQQPFLASMPFGSGKTAYIGGSESWRLRQYKESFHELFWLNMIRFATSGSANREKFGRIVAARKAQVGYVPIEIQIKEAVGMKGEKDDEAQSLVPGIYLPKNSPYKPKIYLRRAGSEKDLAEFPLKPKSSDGAWLGWFDGKVKIETPGDYVLVNKIFAPAEPNPLTAEILDHHIHIDEPKLEDANLREDFDALKELATDAEVIANRMRGELDNLLLPKSAFSADGRKLFFTLDKADRIPDCLDRLAPHSVTVTAGIKDVWDKGRTVPLFLLLWTVPLALLTLFGAVLSFHQKWLMATILFSLGAVVGLTALAYAPFTAHHVINLEDYKEYEHTKFLLIWLVPLILGVLGGAVLMFYRQWLLGVFPFALAVLALTIALMAYLPGWQNWKDIQLHFAVVMVAAVSLLAVEWLTRKLLKLA